MKAIQDYLVKRKRQNYDTIVSCQVIPSLAKEGLSYYPDIPYLKDNAKSHMMDMYCPRMKGPLPVIINVHGDLVSGRKEYNRHFCMNLCKEGYVVFSVNYRLQPEVSLTEQIQDLADAVMHVQKMSIELKMQADNLFLVGDGAGAMLCYYLLAIQNDPELAQLMQIETAPAVISSAAYISGPVYQKDYQQRLVSLSWPKGKKYRGYTYLKTENPILAEHQPPTLFIASPADPGFHKIKRVIDNYRNQQRVNYSLFLEKHSDYYTGMPVADPELPQSVGVIETIAEYFRIWRNNKTY